HYHQPMDWTAAGLEESHKILLSWYEDLPRVSDSEMPSPEILDALCDDLHTPEAITRLHRLKRQGKSAALAASLRLLGFSGDRERLGRSFHLKAETGHYAISSLGSVDMSVVRYPDEQQKQQI